MVRDTGFSRPVIIDIIRAVSSQQHQYDLPFYYQGQLLSTTAQLKVFDSVRTAFGTTAGYQHLWHEAEGRAERSVQWSWLLGGSYYSVTSAADSTTTVHCVRIGAGDPQFNLRNEPGVILRRWERRRRLLPSSNHMACLNPSTRFRASPFHKCLKLLSLHRQKRGPSFRLMRNRPDDGYCALRTQPFLLTIAMRCVWATGSTPGKAIITSLANG